MVCGGGYEGMHVWCVAVGMRVCMCGVWRWVCMCAGMVVGMGVCMCGVWRWVHVYTTHFLACQDLMVAHFTSKSGFCFSATPTRSEGPSWSWPRIREEVTHNIAPTVSERNT